MDFKICPKWYLRFYEILYVTASEAGYATLEKA